MPTFILRSCLGGLDSILGGLTGPGVHLQKMAKEGYMQRLTADERILWMDRFGIEKSILSFPTVSMYMGDEKEVERPKERKKISGFLNDLFEENHAKHPKRLFFFADVPLTVDVEFSCRELHRATKKRGIKGVAIQSNLGGKLPSDPMFEEFFREVEGLGLPVFMHPHSPYGKEKMMKYLVYAIVGYTADVSLAATYMILDGFLERHQDIKIILPHLGGTIPYLYRRLHACTENDYVPPSMSGKANLSKAPDEYLKQFYYDTAIGSPLSLELCLKVSGGSDRILFGSDHPYISWCEARTIDYLSKTKLTVDERNNIYSRNAHKLFDLL